MVAAIVKNQRSFVYNQGTTISHQKQKKFKMAAPGKFKVRTTDIHIHIFGTFLNVTFSPLFRKIENSSILDFIFRRFNINFLQ